jgi:chlorite dismutase
MTSRLFCFAGGNHGAWRVTDTRTVTGDPLATIARLDIIASAAALPAGAAWRLRGVTSNDRYVTREEKNALVAKQQATGRPEATCAAFIPIRKNAAWWALTQDERRAVIEEQSTHIKTGMKYLPAIARRLHHCRDLGGDEPFDFLTWFEFAPADAPVFDDLVAELRATPEWRYVDREFDIRLVRD